VPVASPTGAASGVENVTPFRFADSRPGSQLRITSLSAGVPKRIKLAGVAGLPTGLTAINANLTVVAPAGAGYLTAYNCSTLAPTAASLNYQAMETIGNAGIFPLSAVGDLCVVSSKATQLVVDINGYARPSEDGRLKSTTPTQIVNTESGLGFSDRLQRDTVVELDAFAAGATPGAMAVNVNLTSRETSANGFVTMYPCNVTRPLVATLNPLQGLARSNQAIVPVPADGRLCVYSSTDTDLQVELLGSVLATGSAFTPSTPTRLTDTRDLYRPALNAGTGGSPVAAGQTVTVTYGGQRGIPANSTAVSVNIAITGAAADGTLTVWPCGPRPSVTSMAFRESGTIANGVQAKLSGTGQLCIHSTASAHVIVDIAGWWS
jgi:extracellular elastinolytic metalloproteinase